MRIARVVAVVVGVLMMGTAATSSAVEPAGAGLLVLGGVGLLMAGVFAGRERTG